MSARELITEHLDLWTGAVTKKSSGGRGSNGKVELTGIKKLRELILGMAVQGKLTTREASDEPASELLQRISARQTELYTQGKIKKRKKLLSVSVEERYFHLPENWEWTRLGALFDSIISGGTPSKQNPRFWDGDIPWASVKDLGKTKHLDETQDYITEEGLKVGSKLADTGDVLICTRMGLGKVAICSKPIAINQDLKAVKVSPEVSLDYFFLAYTTLDITGTGTTVAGITQDKLISYVIGLPPIEEQHRIVQKVDELMALCDRLEQQTSNQLEAHETLVDTLLGTLTQSENATELANNWARLAAHFDTLFTTEQSIDKLKQAILQLAVMGRLVEQDAEDEPVGNLRQRIAMTKTQLIETGALRKQRPSPALEQAKVPFTAPGTWEWVTFGEITFNRDAERIPLSMDDRRKRSGEFDYYGASGVIDSIDDYLFDCPLLLIGEDGANLINRATPIAFIARGKYWVNNHAHVIDGISEDFLRYLCLYINAISLEPYVTGTAQPKMNQAKMNSIPVPLPPENEQVRIVQKVDELMALCDQLKERLNQASETRNQLAEAVVEGALN
ncbi:type I restriction endonuclease EcoAI subunit S [Vreelandella aquamarina]|uniref:Type I restriction enzyme, S subunit n=1 Tax=Vreelandella aquamarina TaxID=77097 RepID=A0A1N6D768_9GAMM|nr:restriction endonuclease subunit S [Halomonas meridiana]GED46826.1 type I restriction endonuclease EcoAI subunit S [Halomonas meridiana]SIN61353.1 type I restriction enzyme, S subunit [Halomonas meridiana]SIN66619.1 type I restriction enzyme, S subunit [Halomonas meridiana]SIN98017.1 type I restriction enzyme, S subunit [Halomonas meridiana]